MSFPTGRGLVGQPYVHQRLWPDRGDRLRLRGAVGRKGRRPAHGGAIDNTRLYILDGNLHPVPVGVPGELHIGGTGLARGYLNRPGLTKEKFIPDPFSDEPGSRLYKTGDLCRRRPDGNIEFSGRIDHQVKIRGFRIELGEIESVLSKHERVEQAVVIAREDRPGNKQLVAYMTQKKEDKTLEPGEPREFLEAALPGYMIPSVFIFMDALPLTPNGKIDRKALPEPDFVGPRTHAFVAPRNETEEKLAEIREKLLHVGNISMHDVFFDFGGYSLLIVRLISRIKREFGREISSRELFAAPTIEGLATTIKKKEDAAEPAVREKPIDLQKEALLDSTIKADSAPDRRQAASRRIFLTGATGFIGAFLLKKLLAVTAADIHCLIRESDETEARERVIRNGKTYRVISVQSENGFMGFPVAGV